MPKRTSSAVSDTAVAPRRSTRHKPSAPEAVSRSPAAPPPPGKKAAPKPAAKAEPTASGASKAAPKKKKGPDEADAKPEPPAKRGSKTPSTKPKKAKTEAQAGNGTDAPPSSSLEKNYWLMKAEPETRLENGTDVKFSIDDLAAKTEPEPWDGEFTLRCEASEYCQD